MNRTERHLATTVMLLAGMLVPAIGRAQNQFPEDTDRNEVMPGETRTEPQRGEPQLSTAPANAAELPAPQSDYDPQPPVAAPTTAPETGITAQAGVGGTQAYGRPGVLELGGSAGLAAASDFTQFNLSPSLGWFFVDNMQISGIVGLNYIRAGGEGSSYMTVLAEPSYHFPFTNTLFGFVGVGTGISYAEDPGVGFALAPRVGMNVMVGRSGILTPALQMVWSTADAIQTPQGTLIAVNTSFGANVGYTVMW